MINTIHAENSAIHNAYLHGAKYLTRIAINYAPCGFCRQFMNELPFKYSRNLNVAFPSSTDKFGNPIIIEKKLHEFLP